MGGGNKEKANYNAALTQAQTPSPYEQRRANNVNMAEDWLESGDYTDPPKQLRPFYNFADLAQRNKNRDVLRNTRGQGVSALGAGANPNLLALQKEYDDSQMEEDAARDYQDTTSRIAASTAGELNDLDMADRARRMGVLNTTAGIERQKMSQPTWWEKLLGSATQVGSALAGNPAFIGKFKKGGRWDEEIGEPIEVGEEGPKLALGDDGDAQLLGTSGPQIVVPQKPGVVVLASQTRALVGTVDPSERPASAQAAKGPLSQAVSDFLAAGGTATRPRRALQPTVDDAQARLAKPATPDPNAPVTDTPNPNRPADPTPLPTVGMPPGYDDSGATATRQRWANPVDQETEHNAALRNVAAHPPKEARWKSALKLAGWGLLTGGPGGAIAGAAVGAADPSLPNAMKYGAQVAQSDAHLGQLRAERRQDLADEQTRAQTDWYRARPGIARRSADAAALKQAQLAIQKEIANRMKEPRPFDANDAYDSDLAARAGGASVLRPSDVRRLQEPGHDGDHRPF